MHSKMSVTWTDINAFDVPEHFSCYPAGIANNAVEVETAINKVIDASCSSGSKEWKKAKIRHSNPDNNPFAICHCTAFPDRLILLSCIIELAWINDDVTEELEHKAAMAKHDILIEAMSFENLIKADIGYFNSREMLFGLLVQKACGVDPASAPAVVKVLTNYLRTFDASDEDFTTMDKYNPYRVANCGYWISSFFIRWGMDLTLTDAEYAQIASFDLSMGIILGLTNDYYSWTVEKDQLTDRMRNAVRVLMNEYNVPDTIAKSLLRGLIVDEEEKAARLKREILDDGPSAAVMQYIDAIELYVGGSCYWHATAPRYRV
ncbi:terpenoid synthase [Aspergillus piperis CBS 112811]|uniref:Terpenoid synthase n=1 Tax=Aspergillus piperis CBS 112811 TaxID=1448313 RepID=A0A8G1QZK4_9EURO|nr:terpenoid synthase [Aspergillus piperis CBS 112811]RAH56634.1 terpenoid synthase [Aspergillus piperis CBS 112811]